MNSPTRRLTLVQPNQQNLPTSTPDSRLIRKAYTRHRSAATLRDQASAIHQTLVNGHISTAVAMLHQVPQDRLPYVVFTMTVLAVQSGHQYELSHLFEMEIN